jgi:5-methylcytosine-specific restriction endonuclease McrA
MSYKSIEDQKNKRKEYWKKYWKKNKDKINAGRRKFKQDISPSQYIFEKDDNIYKSDSRDITIAVMAKLKEYIELDYREAMRELYRYYQDSKYWQSLVKEVKIRDKNKCVDCGELILENGRGFIHHTSYVNWGLGDSREVGDCILLCEKCHIKRHRKLIEVPFWAMRDVELSREKQEEIYKLEKECCI